LVVKAADLLVVESPAGGGDLKLHDLWSEKFGTPSVDASQVSVQRAHYRER
jgi:hypothetical protein